MQLNVHRAFAHHKSQNVHLPTNATLAHLKRAVNDAGGVPYRISTETAPGAYDTDFTANAGGPGEWFEVYGEVQTRYSQVYWTRNAPVPLPPDLETQFPVCRWKSEDFVPPPK